MSVKKSHWPLTLMGGSVSLLNLLLPLILVRILNPTDIGQYKIYFLYLALLPWLCLTQGINNGLSHWAGYDDKYLSATRSSWAVSLAIGLLVLIVGESFHHSISTALGWSSLKTHLLIWGVVVSILSTFFEEASIASGHIFRGAIFNSGFDLIRNIAMGTAAYVFKSVEAVFWAHIIVFTVKLIIGVAWGVIEGFQKPLLDRKILSEVARYAFPVSIAAALSIATSYSDQLFMSKMLTAENFAIYSFGCLLIPPLLIFEQSVNRVLIPRMSKAFATGNSLQARSLYQEAIGELAWLHVPAAIALMIFAEPIVELLFTDRYMASAVFLRAYALNYITNHLPYDSVARARGNGRWILKRLIVFSILSSVSVYLLTKQFGAMGGLLGGAFCNFLMKASSLWDVHQTEKWELSKMLPWKEWGQYFALSAMGAIAALSLKGPVGGGIRWFFIGGSAFTVIYIAGTLPKFWRRRNVQVLTEA